MEIKYEAVFGDQALFDGMMGDCEFASEESGYKFVNGTLYYCERYNEKEGWGLSCKSHLTFKPSAMRRIIKTPAWTVADQKAGRLPEVGTKAVQCQEYCTVDILSIRKGYIVVCNSDIDDSRPVTFEVKRFLELFNPIETPAEKAQRLRDEWCSECTSKYYPRGHKGFPEMIYDALLSGELPMPKKGGE